MVYVGGNLTKNLVLYTELDVTCQKSPNPAKPGETYVKNTENRRILDPRKWPKWASDRI